MNNDQPLCIDGILDEINCQEKRLIEFTKIAEEHRRQADIATAKIELITRSINDYKALLEEQTGQSFQSTTDYDNSQEISKEATLKILKQNDQPEGIQVKHIVDAYAQQGIPTHGRLIFRQLEDLINEGRAYQVNPEMKRGRRYRVKDQDSVQITKSTNIEDSSFERVSVFGNS